LTWCQSWSHDGRSTKKETISPFGLIATALVLFAFVSGCSKKPKLELRAADIAMTPYIRFEYAVYLLPKSTKDPLPVLRQVLAKSFPNLKLVDDLPREPSQMFVKANVESDVQRNYAPPGAATMKYFSHGLSDEQSAELGKTAKALKLDFAHPNKDVWTALLAANELVEDIARETDGLIWDEETRDVFSVDAWNERRIGKWQNGVPQISTQTVVHVYENGEFDRAISLGMRKTGLPDVVIQELPVSAERQIVNMINIFSQSMVEGQISGKKREFKMDIRAIRNASLRENQLKSFGANATGIACLSLNKAVLEEGDPENRLIALTFDRYLGNDAHSKQAAAVSWLFGWSDSVTDVEHTDELLEESRKEKADLPRLKKAFEAGLAPGEYLLVKAPFPIPDGSGQEWMWVEVRSWKRGAIRGTLEDQPVRIPSLHSGQVVEVREDEVFDYIRHYPDSREEGNTTAEIIRKLEDTKKASKTSSMLPPPSNCGE
jgi:uncharacterized protein YegJ (DUF2314 family)